MSIQAKADEIRQAISNLNRVTQGLKGLSDSIFPAEKISESVAIAMEPHKADMLKLMDQQCADNKETREKCENLTGEAIQCANTITAHYESRLKAIEAKLAEIFDILEGFCEATNRRRR